MAQLVKNPSTNVGDGINPWVGKIPWRRKWQPTPVFLPEKYHGERGMVGYSPWGVTRVGHDLVSKLSPQLISKNKSLLKASEN